MTTLKAFDDLMNQFISELTRTFPDESPKTPIDSRTFISQITPWSTQMMARDPAFFCEQNEFARAFNLHAIWSRDDCTDGTKKAIWEYISSMYMISTTLNMFPPETLSMIESLAENCAKNMKLDPSGQLDERALMSGMNSMLSQMMSSGSPLASLGNQAPRPRKKKSKQ